MKRFLFFMTVFFFAPPVLMGASPSSNGVGNVDGVLHWSLGAFEPNESKTQTVFLLYADTPEEGRNELKSARNASENAMVVLPDADAVNDKPVWIENGTTDFALFGPCFFRWDVENRQSLRCERGGQLSQFTYYVNYSDSAGKHRAGVPHYEPKQTIENLKTVRSVERTASNTLYGIVATTDDKLQIEVGAKLIAPRTVQVDFRITNTSPGKIGDLTLSTYANFEANHDESNDYATLDAESGSLMIVDLPTTRTVMLAGPNPPFTGHASPWNSFAMMQGAVGIPLADWPTFTGFTDELNEALFQERALAQGYYLPPKFDDPQTPPTRDFTKVEAEQILRNDWDRQAQGEPWAARAVREIAWTRDLAQRILKESSSQSGISDDLFKLSQIEKDLYDLSNRGYDSEAAKKLYYAVRTVKRSIAFKNPVLDFQSVLMIDQPYQTHREGNHESIHRMGMSATPGGRLLVLEGLSPEGRLRQLAPEPGQAGSFWRPDLSFDAEKIVFCYKPAEEKSFKLYEIGLDGTGLKQLTDSDYDDIDPIYLPGGQILFTTTRGNSHVRCGPFIYSYILARCNADGSDLRLISYNGEPDFVPSLLHDGRVIYSRWEYSDKPLWRVQSLWTTNQDGTNTSGFWGNQSVWPDHTSQPRAIPGSERIMFVGVGHHDWWSGSVGIIDPRKGGNFPYGLTKVTADRPWPECSTPPIDPAESIAYHSSGSFTGYSSPYPLSETDFLVSARAEDGKFRLYLMDVDGNRELIYEGLYNIWNAIPIRKRAVPPQQPDRVDWPENGPDRRAEDQEGGTFFNPDVYQGVNGIQRGEVKFLRLMQLDYKTYTTWKKTYRHSGPVVSLVQEEGVKRVLSVVPVEEDGSVFFEAPSGVSLFFQLLDADGRCLHTMRSFSGLMPGENRGCFGCHEMQHSTISPGSGSLAMKRTPTPLSPPDWAAESIGYERYVQPVFDQYCASCHQKDGEDGKKAIDLTLRPGVHIFKEPYLTLLGPAGWGNPVPNTGQPGYGFADVMPVESMDPTMNDPNALLTLPVKRYLSATSRLVDLCASGKHYDVKVDRESLEKIMIWVDACGPYCGEEEIRAMDDPEFEGIERLPIRPRVKTAPVVLRP